MAVEFVAEVKDLKEALRIVFASIPKGKRAEVECFDLSAKHGQLTLDGQGFSHVCPAKVASMGFARVTYRIINRVRPFLLGVRETSIAVSIAEGQLKLAGTTLSDPEISIRPIGSRIGELPLDAPLPLVLALTTRFTPEELEDSGLTRRVLEATAEATKLIDGAAKLLEPLGVAREAISTFVMQQIRASYGPQRNHPPHGGD